MNEAKLLHDKIVGVGISLESVRKRGAVFELVFPPSTTQARRDQAEAIRLGFDPVAAEQLSRRAAAKGLLDDPGPEGIWERAKMRLLGQQLNPPQTVAQLRAIMDADIDTGACDGAR